MTMSVVWIDLEKAKLFHFSEDCMKRESEVRGQRDGVRLEMFDQVAEKLRQSRRILILGPGIAKTGLRERLEERFPEIARKVVGCESADHPSDQQIAAYALRYFQRPV